MGKEMGEILVFGLHSVSSMESHLKYFQNKK